MMIEKRHYHRLNVAMPISYRVPPRRESAYATSMDIGGTGLSLITSEKLSLRQELLLYPLLPGNKRIEIHGKVIRIEDEGNSKRIGVKIMDPIKFDEREYVKFYVGELIETYSK